jgi:starch-binding outer membrane protein, SusD/RagB family
MSPDNHRPTHMQNHSARPPRKRAWAFLSIALLCTAVACNNLLDVKSPDAINAKSLDNPLIAEQTVNASIGDFDCALSSYVVAAGLMSGELTDATLTASRWSYDRRDIDPNESAYSTNDCLESDLGTYTPISTARFTADRILTLLEGWPDDSVPNRSFLISEAASFGGYTRILLGEGFCNAAIAGGPSLTSAQIFALAAGKFDTAVTAAQAALAAAITANDTVGAGKDSSALYLALVGRARSELDAGQNAQAIADASLVPSGFVYNATYDAGTDYRTNHVYTENNADQTVSVAPPYENLNDPRVPVTNQHSTASDEKTPLFTQGKYSDGSAPIPMASYVEAQLIVAEATGGPGAITILNNLRSSAGLGALASSSDPAVITADIASERARWLWLQGQHLYDVRRLGLPLVPAAGSSYSIYYHKGGNYGSETCMPIPAVETNDNPNARG